MRLSRGLVHWTRSRPELEGARLEAESEPEAAVAPLAENRAASPSESPSPGAFEHRTPGERLAPEPAQTSALDTADTPGHGGAAREPATAEPAVSPMQREAALEPESQSTSAQGGTGDTAS